MTTTAFDRKLRELEERVGILWGSRGAAGYPERAVRLREIGSLPGSGSQAGSGVTSVNGMTGAVVIGGIKFVVGAGLPTGGSYADGDRAFDTDTGREYTFVDGAWLDLNGSGGLAARSTATIASGSGSVAIGKSAVLVELAATAAARCRFYCTAAARDADAARAAGAAVPQGAGLILEFIATDMFLGAPLTPAPVAYNLDGPVANSLYYNIEPVGGAMTVDLTYLPLGN